MPRRPLPPFLKLVKGTMRGKKKAPSKPSTLGPPLPPAFLSADARREWDVQAPLLFKLGRVTQLDAAALGAYCVAYARWQAAESVLAQMAADDVTGTAGLIMTTKTGRQIAHPLLAICRTAMLLTMKFAGELGLSPRSRVNVDPPHDPNDPAMKYI